VEKVENFPPLQYLHMRDLRKGKLVKKSIVAIAVLLATSCYHLEYEVIKIEPVGEKYHVVYRINNHVQEDFMDDLKLERLLEAARVGIR